MAGKSAYTPQLGLQICELIAGGYTLRQVANQEGMPVVQTILRWAVNDKLMLDDKPFSYHYSRAMQIRLEAMANEIIDISDDGVNDWITKENRQGREYTAFNQESFQRSRLRVDARKWLLTKLMPDKYGEKLQSQLTGANGAALTPIFQIHVHEDPNQNLSEKQPKPLPKQSLEIEDKSVKILDHKSESKDVSKTSVEDERTKDGE